MFFMQPTKKKKLAPQKTLFRTKKKNVHPKKDGPKLESGIPGGNGQNARIRVFKIPESARSYLNLETRVPARFEKQLLASKRDSARTF